MKRAMIVTLIAAGIVVLGASSSGAHVPNVYADCQNGVHVTGVRYHPEVINSVVVMFDGKVVFANPDFGEGFDFTYPNPDKSVGHVFDVTIGSGDGIGALVTGPTRLVACETPPVPPTTTTPPRVAPATPTPILAPPAAVQRPVPIVATVAFTG